MSGRLQILGIFNPNKTKLEVKSALTRNPSINLFSNSNLIPAHIYKIELLNLKLELNLVFNDSFPLFFYSAQYRYDWEIN